MGFKCLKAEEPLRGGCLLVILPLSSRNFWYSFDGPRKEFIIINNLFKFDDKKNLQVVNLLQ